MLKKKNKIFLAISSLLVITTVIIFSIFISRIHTHVNIDSDKLEIASYDYDNRKAIENSYLSFDWANADLDNKTVAFTGIKYNATLFDKSNGEYDTLEIPTEVKYGGSNTDYTDQYFTVTKICQPTVTSADLNSSAGYYTYDLVRGLIIPTSVTEIQAAAFLPYARLEYLETPFIGQYRDITNDQESPLGSMFSSIAPYYALSDDDTTPDLSKYNNTNTPELYERTIEGVIYSNKNSISRWYPQTLTNQVKAYLFPEKLTTVVVTDDTRIPEKAFLELKTVKSITLPDTLTNLNSLGCITHCLALEEINFPKTATIIGVEFLSDCKALTEVTLPDGITEIPKGMFSRCISLTTVNIPASVKIVGDQAFLGCVLLDTLKVFTTNSTTHEIDGYVNSSGFALPAGIEKIQTEAFNGCKFDDISISSTSLQYIEEGAFKACNYLQTITLPFIGYQANNRGVDAHGQAMFGWVFGSGTCVQQFGSSSSDVYSSNIPTTLKTITITNEPYVSRGSMSNLPNVERVLITHIDSSQVIEQGAFEKNSTLVDISVPYVGNNQEGSRFCSIFGKEPYTGGYLAQDYYYVPTTLKKITVTNMPYIKTGAFKDMTTITDVTISNVTTYCEQAIFYNNVKLTNLSIPFAGKYRGEEYYWWSWHGNYERQNSIGWIFSQSTSSDEYPLTILRYSSGDGYARWIPNTLKSISITDETIIGPYVFQGLKSLETITVSNDGTGNVPSSFAEGCMWGCSNLKNLNLPYIGANKNENGNSGRAYTIGWYFGTSDYDNSYSAYEYSYFKIPKNLARITVASSNNVSIKVIPAYSFANLTSLVSFSTTAKVTTLADHVFYNDVNLANVKTDNATYTKVGDYAFANCSKVNVIYDDADHYFVPNTVREIGDYAFSGTAISSVDFSTTAAYQLTKVGNYAFDSCSKITEVTIPGLGGQYTLISLGEGAFANCDTLVDVDLGPDAASKYLFKNCTSLETISLNSVVTYVPEGMFYGCTSLKNLTLDDITTEIGQYAFYGCESLKNFTIKGTTTKIGSYAFTNCSGLEYMFMPRNVLTIEANGFYGCDRDNFYFYVLDPESDWPAGWVNNWNCDYPVYIYGEAAEEVFQYNYVSDLRGYEITGITGITGIDKNSSEYNNKYEDYFVGTLQFPSTYNGVRIVSIGENVLAEQPRVTSVIIPSSVRRIKGTSTPSSGGITCTGGLYNGNVITVFFDISADKAKNPGKYYKDSDAETATGENIPVLFGNENNWFTYGFVYYNDYWGYTQQGKVKVPYLKISEFDYILDSTKDGLLFYDGSNQTIEVTHVMTKAQVVEGGVVIYENAERTGFPTTAIGLTPYLPVDLFDFAYSDNIKASEEAKITATVNINKLSQFNDDVLNGTKPQTTIYVNGGAQIGVTVNNKTATTEKLYLGGTGTKYFTINKKQITLFPTGEEYETSYGTPWVWSEWSDAYVDGIAGTGFKITGTLTTKNDIAGVYKSDEDAFITGSLGDFVWKSGPRITLNNANVTDNFEIVLSGELDPDTGATYILKVTIKPLNVAIAWTGGKWANDSTNFYTDYDNSKINDFYLWGYTGEIIEPTATAYVATVDLNDNPVLGKEIKGITNVINSTDGYGYPHLERKYPNYPDYVSTWANCNSSATAYLVEDNNYNLVYYDLDANKWKDVPYHSTTSRREVVVRYAVMKRDLTIIIENDDYLIGYDDDYWANDTWPATDVTITGLNNGSKIAGKLKTYYYEAVNVDASSFDPTIHYIYENGIFKQASSYSSGTQYYTRPNYVKNGDYYLKQVDDNKEYTNSTYANICQFIDWEKQIFNYVDLYSATPLDFMIYRQEEDSNGNITYVYENDYYNFNLEAHIDIKYNTFVPIVKIDGVEVEIKGTTEIGGDTYNVIEYPTEGKFHRFSADVSNTGIILNSSNIIYRYGDNVQQGATYYEFRTLNDDGYQVGVTFKRKNFNELYQNYLIRVVKSEYEFEDLTKEYDGNPVTPVASNKPTLDTYTDLQSNEHPCDPGAQQSIDSLEYTYYKCKTKAQCSDANKLTSAPYEIADYVVHITADGSDFFKPYDEWIEFSITKRKIVIDLGTTDWKYYDLYPNVIQIDFTTADNYKILEGHRLVATLQTVSSLPGIYYGTGSHFDDEGNEILDVYSTYWKWKNQPKVITIQDSTDVTKYYDFEVIGKFEIKKRVIYDYDPLDDTKEAVESYGAPDPDYNPSNWDGKYDGLPHTITVILHNLPATAMVYYTETEINNEDDDEGISWTSSNIQKIIPGDYIIYYKVAVPNYATYYGQETIKIINQDIEYSVGQSYFEYDGAWHKFEVTVQYPLSAVVEYSTDGQNWTTNYYEYINYMDEDPTPYVRIYYRITADNFNSIGLNLDKYVDFTITQSGFEELDPGDFTIVGYDEFYDGNAHTVTVTKNNTSIYNEKIYYSLTDTSDLSSWSLNAIQITNVTSNPVKIYVRIVDAKIGSQRYKDAHGEAYSATVYIKPLNFDSLTVTNYDEDYDGKSHTVTINGLDAFQGVNYTIYYSKDPNSEASGSGWSTTPVEFKNASEQANIIYIKIEAENYTTKYLTGQVRIHTVKLAGVVDDGNTKYTPFKIQYTSEPVAYDAIPVNTLNPDGTITEGMIHDGVKTYTFYKAVKDVVEDENDNLVDANYYALGTEIIARPTKLGVYCVKIIYANSTNCVGRDAQGNVETMVVWGWIEIVAKEVKVTYQKTQQYTGKALSPGFEVSTGTKDIITLNIQIIEPANLEPNQVIDIGTYKYKVSINEATDLYVLPEEFNDLIEFTITKRKLSISINTTQIFEANKIWTKDSGLQYDGWDEYMSGSLIEGHVLDLSMFTSSYVRGTYAYPSNAMSQYSITVSTLDILDTKNDNASVLDKYEVIVNAIVKIVFKSKTHDFKDRTVDYDGEEHGLTLSIDDNEIINPVITFTEDDLSEMTDEEKRNADWSLYSPKYINAGEYVINVRIQSDNLEDIYTTAKLIIKKTKLQVKINTFDLIYDATAHTVTSTVTNISSKIADSIQPIAVKYYDSEVYTKAQLNTAFKVSEYSKVDEYIFGKGLNSCTDAGTYYAVVLYLESDNYEFGYFIAETVIEKKDIQVQLGAYNITNVKNYDGKVMYQTLNGGTINTSDLLTGHEAKSGSDLRKYRIKTNSSYAGTYEPHYINNSGLTLEEKKALKDFEFHDANLIIDSDTGLDVTKNYHPVIVTGITFVISKIGFTFSVDAETTKAYATEVSDAVSGDYVINGFQAKLASPNMVLPNNTNPNYFFDNEPIYTWYTVNSDNTIGSYIGSTENGDRISDVGDYYVMVKFAEGTNFDAYTLEDKIGLVHITPMIVDVDWDDLIQDFDGSGLRPIATYTDGFDTTIGLDVTILAYENSQLVSKDYVVPAGSYQVYASFGITDIDSKNYQLSLSTSGETFVINKLTFTYNVFNTNYTTYNNQSDWSVDISKTDFEGFPENLKLVGPEGTTARLKTNGHDLGIYYYGPYYEKQLVFEYRVLDANDNDFTSSIELVASGYVVIYTDTIRFEVTNIDIPYDGLYHTVLEGIKVLNPANETQYQINVKKTTETAYDGSPTSDEYKFINVGTHVVDFMIVSSVGATEKKATGQITITIRQVAADAIIKGSLDKEYDGLPVSETTIKVEGSYNKHPDGKLIYTYYRTDSAYSNPVKISTTDPTDPLYSTSGPKNVGYYMVQITNSADSIADSASYVKNYTALVLEKTFEIKARDISYTYEAEQVVLNVTKANGYPDYANGFNGSILQNATWQYNPDALTASSIGLALTDELHIILQSNNNGNDLYLKVYEYNGILQYLYNDTYDNPISQNFYSDTNVTDYFAIKWWVQTSTGENVSFNYRFEFGFELDVHYPDIDHTITPTYAPAEKGVYAPGTKHSATITFGNTVAPNSSVVTQGYSNPSITGTKSNISEMQFEDPGRYSVNYSLTASGYRDFHGSYIIDISYSTRTLTDEFAAKKDSLSKVYDGNPVTLSDIVGLSGANLKWHNSGDVDCVFKTGLYADNIVDSNVTIVFTGYNSTSQSIQDVGTYNYTITVPGTTYYSETIITGTYQITRATITVKNRIDNNNEVFYTTGYTGGRAYYTVEQNDPYYQVLMNGNPLPTGFVFKGTLQTTGSEVGTYTSTAAHIVPMSSYVINGGGSNYTVNLDVTIQILPGAIVATTSDITLPYTVSYTYNKVIGLTKDTFKAYKYYTKVNNDYYVASTFNSLAEYYERVDGVAVTRYPTITYITPGQEEITSVMYKEEGSSSWQAEPIGVSTPGTKVINIKISSTNFEDKLLTSTITITKAETEIYIPTMTRAYNGQFVGLPQDLRIDSDASMEDVVKEYYIYTSNTWQFMNSIPINVGKYKLVIEVPENASNLYKGKQAVREFEITKKEVNVVWYKDASEVNQTNPSSVEYTYDGLVHIPYALLNTGLVVNGQAVTPNYSVNVTSFADQNTVIDKPWLADVYVATVKIDDDTNWEFASDEMSYTYAIKKRTITIMLLGNRKTYDGTIAEFTYTADVESIPTADKYKYYYALNMPSYEINGATKYDFFDSLSILQTANKNYDMYESYNNTLGTDFVWDNGYEIYNLSFAGGNNTLVTDCYVINYDLSFAIGPDAIQFSAPSYEITYDGQKHYLDIQIDNPEPATIYYSEDDGQTYNRLSTEEKDGVNVFTNVKYDGAGNVVPYDIKFKIVIENYQTEYVTRTIQINPKPANLYLKNKVLDHEYDGLNIDDASSTVYLTTADFDYIDSQSNPRTITLTYEIYDANDGWIVATDTSNVGKYRVTATLDAGNNKNYSGGTKTYEFSVTRRTITITTKDSNGNLLKQQKTYNGLSLTYPVDSNEDVLNLVPNETFTGTVKSKYAYVGTYQNQDDFEWVSGYKIEREVVSGNTTKKVNVTDNYIIQFRLIFDILSAPITATVTNLEDVVDDLGQPIYIDGKKKQAVIGKVGGNISFSINLSVSGPTLYTVKYDYIDENTNELKTSITNPKFKRQGEHTVKYTVSADNYTTVTGEALVMIKGLDTDGGYIDYLPVAVFNNTPYMSQTVNTKPVYVSDSEGVQTITYYDSDNKVISCPTNAGSYKFTIHIAEWGDYEEYTTNKTPFEIERISREVQWEDYEVTYNGDYQKPKAYILAYDNVTKLYLEVAEEYVETKVTGYEVSAAFADTDTNRFNYTLTKNVKTDFFKIYPIEVEKPSISTSLEFIYSELYTLYDIDGNPICDKDENDKDIYEEVTEPFNSETTYYTYDDVNETYVKCENLNGFDSNTTYYLPKFKVFRFGDEVKVKDTSGNIYVLSEEGIIIGLIDKNDPTNNLDIPTDANLYKIEISTDRNIDELMAAGVKHVFTVSLIDDKNYVWKDTNYDDFINVNYDDSYEIAFKIKQFDADNNVEGLKVEVVPEYKYYIMDINDEIVPSAEVRLVTADGLLVRIISSGRLSNKEAYLIDLDNKVSTPDDYNVLGKIKASGMQNIKFSVTGTYEKRATPPVLFEMKDNTIRRYVEITVTGTNNKVEKNFGTNQTGVERTETKSTIYLGRIYQDTKIIDILNDFKNDNSLMEVYDFDGNLVNPSQYSTKSFGTGFKIVLYSDSEHQNKIDEITGIVFGDLNGDGKVTNLDVAKSQNLYKKVITYDGNELAYIAGTVNNETGVTNISVANLQNMYKNLVDINSDYKVTPEELYA